MMKELLVVFMVVLATVLGSQVFLEFFAKIEFHSQSSNMQIVDQLEELVLPISGSS